MFKISQATREIEQTIESEAIFYSFWWFGVRRCCLAWHFTSHLNVVRVAWPWRKPLFSQLTHTQAHTYQTQSQIITTNGRFYSFFPSLCFHLFIWFICVRAFAPQKIKTEKKNRVTLSSPNHSFFGYRTVKLQIFACECWFCIRTTVLFTSSLISITVDDGCCLS